MSCLVSSREAVITLKYLDKGTRYHNLTRDSIADSIAFNNYVIELLLII